MQKNEGIYKEYISDVLKVELPSTEIIQIIIERIGSEK